MKLLVQVDKKSTLFKAAIILLAGLSSIFLQGDLRHTLLTSYSMFEGHFFDFYDHAASFAGKSDYLFVIYLLFAIWFLPILALGLTSSQSEILVSDLTLIEVFWAKALLGVFFYLTIQGLLKIKKIFADLRDNPKQEIANMDFAWSPFAIYSIFLMGQYDIVWVCISTWAIYFLLRQKYGWSFALFGIAFTVKYFAFVFIVAFVFMYFREIKARPTKLTLLALPTLLCYLLFLSNETFREGIFELPLRILTQNVGSLLAGVLVFIGVFGLLRVIPKHFEFLNRLLAPVNELEKFRAAIGIAAVCFLVLFTFFRWNPQWLLVLSFLASLAQIATKRQPLYRLIEAAGFAGLAILMLTFWSGNLDQSMLRASSKQFDFAVIGFAADLLPAWLVFISLVLVHLWILVPAAITLWPKLFYSRIEFRTTMAKFAILACSLGVWLVPVSSTLFPYAKASDQQIYALTQKKPYAAATYHTRLSGQSDNFEIRFLNASTKEPVLGVVLDVANSAELAASKMTFSFFKEEKKVCSGMVFIKPRSPDVLWVKGWSSAYAFCQTPMSADHVRFSADKTFRVWIDSNSSNQIATWSGENGSQPALRVFK